MSRCSTASGLKPSVNLYEESLFGFMWSLGFYDCMLFIYMYVYSRQNSCIPSCGCSTNTITCWRAVTKQVSCTRNTYKCPCMTLKKFVNTREFLHLSIKFELSCTVGKLYIGVQQKSRQLQGQDSRRDEICNCYLLRTKHQSD